MTRFPKTYAMLKASGHSPAKAAEIIIDAARGNSYALTWIGIIWRLRHTAELRPAAGLR